MGIGAFQRRLSLPFIALAMAGVLVRALIAPGFMLAPEGRGAAVVICTEHGPALAPIPAPAPAHKGKAEGVCPFAASAQWAGPATGEFLPAPIRIAQRFVPPVRVTRDASSPPALPPPARGPPSLV